MWPVKIKMKKTVLIIFYILSLNTVNSQLFTKEKVINNENFDKYSLKPKLIIFVFVLSKFNSFIDDINDEMFTVKLDNTKYITPERKAGDIGCYVIVFYKYIDNFSFYNDGSMYDTLLSDAKDLRDNYISDNNLTGIILNDTDKIRLNSYYKEYDNINEEENFMWINILSLE